MTNVMDVVHTVPHRDGRQVVEVSWRPDENEHMPWAVETFDPAAQDWTKIRRERWLIAAKITARVQALGF